MVKISRRMSFLRGRDAWLLAGCLGVALCLVSARADTVVMSKAMNASTVAEVFIEEDSVRVDLEIGVDDLQGFVNLLPNELLERMGVEAAPLAERLPVFFAEDLTLRADGGPPLPGFVTVMEGRQRITRDEITGEPLQLGTNQPASIVFAQLVYPLETHPDVLAIKPPQDRVGGTIKASIGFTTYHHGLPVMDFRYLSKEETLDLDWEDPWYSQYRNKSLWRSYREPINVFIYVEPFEVRAEIVVRPFDLQQWIDLGIEGQPTIPVEVQAELKRKVAEFIGAHLNLTIDGQLFSPPPDRVNFLRRTLRSSTVVDPPEALDVYSATLGVIFVQPMTGLPQKVSVTWDLFSPKMDRVRAAATDEAGPLPCYLTPDETVLTWRNFLKHPTIPSLAAVAPPPPAHLAVCRAVAWLIAVVLSLAALLCLTRRPARRRAALLSGLAALLMIAGGFAADRGRRLDPAEAEAVLSPLLANIYHSFDFREEEKVYDTLAHSLNGDLLTRVYIETRKGLELASQGGARVKVKRVELIDFEPEPLPRGKGFRTTCTWNVTGAVGHWGHVHQRTNQYRADLTVEPVDGQWKLTVVDIIEEQRIL